MKRHPLWWTKYNYIFVWMSVIMELILGKRSVYWDYNDGIALDDSYNRRARHR